jgi:peroxiredoxin Q/BCP
MGSLEGKRAPAFTLEGSDGKKHSLEDYCGNTVVLYFFRRMTRPGAPRKRADSGILGHR